MLEEKKDQGVKTKHSMATKHEKEKVIAQNHAQLCYGRIIPI